MSIMREYDDRRQIDNIYEKAKKNIKKKIETKGLEMKGSTKGQALSEIMAVIDEEMEIDIAEELVNARRILRQFYNKYNEVESLERKIYEKKKILEEQEKVANIASMLTDDVLKNAIIAYNAIKNDYRRGSEDARAIAIAYITSKGREDLKDTFTEVEDGTN